MRDGHDFAPEVAAKGAAVLIVEKEVTVPDEVTVIRGGRQQVSACTAFSSIF